MPRLPKNLKISFEKSPLPRQVLTPVEEEASPLMETLMLQEPDIDALDDVIDEMIPQFVEKDPPVVSEIFAPPEPKKPKKPPSILKVAERVELPPPPPKVAKLTKTGKVRKEMSEAQKAKARENLKKARELRASRLKAQAPPEPEPVPEPVYEAPAPVHVPAPAPQVPLPAPAPAPVQSRGISAADLQKSNLDAIMEYESIRKERKRVKREKQMIDQQRQDVIGVARKASMSGWANTAGQFSNCY
tara:strand:+ start:247 stop:981 length:735 start_codon:yes stop_codon:yes gene_type:complete